MPVQIQCPSWGSVRRSAVSMSVPSFMLKKLYKKGSLRQSPEGLEFTLENSLSTANLTKLEQVTVDGTVYGADQVEVLVDGTVKPATDFSNEAPLTFARGAA